MAQVASFIYDRPPGILPVLFYFSLCSFLLIRRGHSNVHILAIFTGGFLRGEASFPEEVMEVLAPVLETPANEGEAGVIVPLSKVEVEMELALIPILKVAITNQCWSPSLFGLGGNGYRAKRWSLFRFQFQRQWTPTKKRTLLLPVQKLFLLGWTFPAPFRRILSSPQLNLWL